jgi:DNA-3-methyladenine glycosylase
MGRRATLARSFFDRSALVVAPELLNKVLVAGDRAVRIVEVEAYAGADDPASHAFRGPTPRNATMFGPPGHLYVYFTYGMHWCANAVCGPGAIPSAVLLRAGAPLSGLDEMRIARRQGRSVARRDRDLGRGPARLAQALGIDRQLDGADLTRARGAIRIADDGTAPPDHPGRSARVGIRLAVERPWRWYVAGDPNVSGPSVATSEDDR